MVIDAYTKQNHCQPQFSVPLHPNYFGRRDNLLATYHRLSYTIAKARLSMANLRSQNTENEEPPIVLKQRATPWVPINAKGYQFDTHF